MQVLEKLVERFKEPSSWAGLAGVVGLFGVNLPPNVAQNITMTGAGLCGLIAFMLPEGKSK